MSQIKKRMSTLREMRDEGCHVDGIDRIMVSSRESSLISWATIPNVYLKGEPHFTFGEAKAAWTHIVTNFAAGSLSSP